MDIIVKIRYEIFLSFSVLYASFRSIVDSERSRNQRPGYLSLSLSGNHSLENWQNLLKRLHSLLDFKYGRSQRKGFEFVPGKWILWVGFP